MIIALASPRIATSLDDGLEKVRRLLSEASARGAEIVCFPEAYLPGLRGLDFEVPPFDRTQHERALDAVAQWARTYAVATILGMERLTEGGRQIVAYVLDARGQLQGYQTKNQLDPTEDRFYVPGNTRRIFEIDGTRFGVAICHEGWRYPETVRWAATRGAKIVFHPQHTGSDRDGVRPTRWGATEGPYYEKAMMMRSIENTIYFASVNYALRYQESATSLITPSGECQAYLPYGEEGVLVQDIHLEEATGLLAGRYAPERYRESDAGLHGDETTGRRGMRSDLRRVPMASLAKPPATRLSAALPGTWELVSRTDVTDSGERLLEPSLGDDPVAILIYDRSGHFAAQFMKRDRSTLVADAPAGALNNSRAQGGYDAYFGSYSVDDSQSTVTQQLLGALSSENVGQILTRGMKVEGDVLTIALRTTSARGVPVTRTLVWRRVG